MAGFGNLPPMQGQPQAQQATPVTPQMPGQPVDPSGGGAGGRAGIWYGIGNIYDSYKKAKMDEITQANDLNKAGRERLTQLYELGVRNPEIQKDPRVHQQINHLFQTMGLPATAGQPGFEWSSLQPVKTMDDLKPDTIKLLEQMMPDKRRASAKQLGLSANEDWLNQPAKLPDLEIAQARNKFDQMMQSGSWASMTPSQLHMYFEMNRIPLGQSFADYGVVDKYMAMPEIFDTMSTKERLKAQQLQNAVDMSFINMDKARAQVGLIRADIEKAHSVKDLVDTRNKIAEVTLKDLPEMDAKKIADYNSKIAAREANVSIARQRLDNVKAKQSKDPGIGYLQRQASEARYNAVHFDNLLQRSIQAQMGVPPDLIQAQKDAHEQYKAYKAMLDEATSPAIQQTIHAAAAQQTTGATAVPVKGAR